MSYRGVQHCQNNENADSADFGRFWACWRTLDCQEIFTTKDTRNYKGHKGNWLINWLIVGIWGAAPRPGREKFSLHPRHVCDVP